MKAMVLAAGLGTRLKDITKTTPKCLVDAGGQTMLEHTLDALKRCGVTEVVVNLFHLGEKVRDFCSHTSFRGMKIEFSPEDELLGTGGGILHAQRFFSDAESFIVHNADIYSTIDLAAMCEAHKASGAMATLAVMNRNTDRLLLFNEENNLAGWQNGETQTAPSDGVFHGFAFCGIQVVSTALFPILAERKPPFSIITSYLDAASRGALVQAFRVDEAYWLDVGTPEKLQVLRERLSSP